MNLKSYLKKTLTPFRFVYLCTKAISIMLFHVFLASICNLFASKILHEVDFGNGHILVLCDPWTKRQSHLAQHNKQHSREELWGAEIVNHLSPMWPRFDSQTAIIYGLRFLLVLILVLRGFSWATPVFPFLHKPNISGFQHFDLERVPI